MTSTIAITATTRRTEPRTSARLAVSAFAVTTLGYAITNKSMPHPGATATTIRAYTDGHHATVLVGSLLLIASAAALAAAAAVLRRAAHAGTAITTAVLGAMLAAAALTISALATVISARPGLDDATVTAWAHGAFL
ncbi:hypothetical protein ACIRRA_45865, partial [Nocardia sp. NPDC101769]